MSKSMAIEGVMKIFLMIAVIIVGMSFLLKALGIDIFEWIKSKFGGFGVPGSGLVLHIKTDPDDEELFEFYISNGFDSGNWPDNFGETEKHKVIQAEGARFFTVSNLPTNGCVIFTTDENGGDQGMTYKVASGTTIDGSCEGKTLEQCIIPANVLEGSCKIVSAALPIDCGGTPCKCEGNNCALLGECSSGSCTSNYVKPYTCHNSYKNYLVCAFAFLTLEETCAEEEKVLKSNKLKFGVGVVKFKGPCKDGEVKKCNLLGETKKILEDLEDSKVYQVKFGVVCDGAKWQVCTPEKAEKVETAQGKTCQAASGGEYWVWEGASGQLGSQLCSQCPGSGTYNAAHNHCHSGICLVGPTCPVGYTAIADGCSHPAGRCVAPCPT